MELHEAVKKARKELGLSQQKLADLAGIERKQLSILENGGNVTLTTIRKIVAHLPNMPPFTLGGVSGRIALMPEEQQMQVAMAAINALQLALRSALGPLGKGRIPSDDDAKLLDEANRELHRSMGRPDDEYQQMLDGIAAEQASQPVLTEEESAAMLAQLAEELQFVDLGEGNEEDAPDEAKPDPQK